MTKTAATSGLPAAGIAVRDLIMASSPGGWLLELGRYRREGKRVERCAAIAISFRASASRRAPVDRPMSGAQALAVPEPVCAALAAAHELGVVHRDVKASSVMVCRGAGGVRRVVLLDFGIARPSDALAGGHPDRQLWPSRSVCPSRQVTLPVTENVRSRR